MAVVLEKIDIAGEEVGVYKLTGHETHELVILDQALSPLDRKRLIVACSGDLKARDLDNYHGEVVTGDCLNLVQAFFPENGMWAIDYFLELLEDLGELKNRTTRSKIDNDMSGAIMSLMTRIDGGHGTVDP